MKICDACEEEKFNNLQQLKAEITAIVNDFDRAGDILDFGYAVKYRMGKLRELAAVQQIRRKISEEVATCSASTHTGRPKLLDLLKLIEFNIRSGCYNTALERINQAVEQLRASAANRCRKCHVL